jgi:UDP-N-acetylmuramate dehydrogenase
MSWYADLADSVRLDVPLAPLTWFGLGGPAKFFVTPRSLEELQTVLGRLRENEIPIYVLGGGANVLVRDEGVSGAVVALSNECFRTVAINGQIVRAGAGKDVQKLVLECTHAGLSGLECLAGIPGTVGGEVKMNAGGTFGDIGASVQRLTVMDKNGQVEVREKDELVFEYRRSNISAKFILDATFNLEPDDPQRILAKVKEIWMFKKNSQPLADKSAGCIFKNPRGLAAGALIDQAGLKGTVRGAAEISSKHGNFIVAHKGATAADVLGLIELARQKVAERFDVQLETEVVIW